MANAERGQRYEHVCCGCNEVLPVKHLRVNVAPPDQKWEMLRAHDLLCFIDFLEDEETGDVERRVFTRPKWIDALGTSSVTSP